MNGALAWRLFKTEYLDQMKSIEGVFIALARYIRDHFSGTAWWPFWYCGMPFRNTYQPALPFTTAAISALTGLSPARAFHIVEAVLYALGPVTVYWLARRLSASTGAGLAAGLLYSLTSPSAWFVPEIRADLGGAFLAQRLHTMVVYGDGPHVTSLTFLPLALLALHNAIEHGRSWRVVLAACALAAVPLSNWPGAIDLAFAALAYLIAYCTAPARLVRAASIAALAYGISCRSMPPSLIARFIANVQGLEPRYRFSAVHLAYALGLSLVMAAVYFALARITRPGTFNLPGSFSSRPRPSCWLPIAPTSSFSRSPIDFISRWRWPSSSWPSSRPSVPSPRAHPSGFPSPSRSPRSAPSSPSTSTASKNASSARSTSAGPANTPSPAGSTLTPAAA